MLLALAVAGDAAAESLDPCQRRPWLGIRSEREFVWRLRLERDCRRASPRGRCDLWLRLPHQTESQYGGLLARRSRCRARRPR